MPTTRVGARPGQDGLSATITTPPGQSPGMADVGIRLKKNREVWDELKSSMTSDPDSYAGDRFTNDRMPVKGQKGVPPAGTGFGGGYHGRLKTRPADRRVSITSSRPYSPGFTDDFISRMEDVLIEWWLDGEA